ncbi:hypothetical protein ASQ43_08515 [Parasaccharibacter apium]|uniref:Uncharacterized protein n=1 Tax=Parasaccharibacter apium TaxID=1510841 RepID=A0ABX4ZLJ5_9PROT|nr:hypothetical protein ASQ43_08515 [Parasaccharibacter apium]POS62456.1 hypothetical protein ASQ42_06625 [Parasaccharibacter apium]POS66237.1 hypothetical protein ASO19_00020 [Parasaccharibacter apium]
MARLRGRLSLLVLCDPIDDRAFDGLLDLLVQVVGVFWREANIEARCLNDRACWAVGFALLQQRARDDAGRCGAVIIGQRGYVIAKPVRRGATVALTDFVISDELLNDGANPPKNTGRRFDREGLIRGGR